MRWCISTSHLYAQWNLVVLMNAENGLKVYDDRQARSPNSFSHVKPTPVARIKSSSPCLILQRARQLSRVHLGIFAPQSDGHPQRLNRRWPDGDHAKHVPLVQRQALACGAASGYLITKFRRRRSTSSGTVLGAGLTVGTRCIPLGCDLHSTESSQPSYKPQAYPLTRRELVSHLLI